MIDVTPRAHMALQTEESRNASINARLNAMRGGGNGASIRRRRDIAQGTQSTDAVVGHPANPTDRDNNANAIFMRYMNDNGIDPRNCSASNAEHFSAIYVGEMVTWRQQYIRNPQSASEQLPTILNDLRIQFG